MKKNQTPGFSLTGRGGIRHLGFVIDHSKPPLEILDCCLVVFKDSPNKADILWPDNNGYRTRYSRRLFIVAALAASRFHTDATCRGDTDDIVLAGPDDRDYAYLTEYLRQQARYDKLQSIPSDIRLAINQSLFHPQIKEKSPRLVWPAGTPKDSLFFLARSDLQKAGIELPLQGTPTVAISPQKCIGAGSLSSATISALAAALNGQERISSDRPSWQDLYRGALAAFFTVPAFIPPKVISVPLPEQAGSSAPQTPVDFHDVVTRCRRIFLTGKSGAGKSTLLSCLAAQIASGREAFGLKNPFPIYVRLAHFDDPSCERVSLEKAFAASIAESVTCLPHSELSRLCVPRRTSEQPGASWTEILERIRQEVLSFLGDIGHTRGDLVFLLDGYNEIRPEAQAAFDRAMTEFIQRLESRHAYACIISGRSFAPCGTERSALLSRFEHYELAELTDKQLQRYLTEIIGQDRTRIFIREQVETDPYLNDLLKSPIFLAYAAGLLLDNPHMDIPRSLPLLLQSFITSNLDKAARRSPEAAEVFMPDVHALMAAIASTLIITQRPWLTYPSEIPAPTRPIHLFRVLKRAEAAGILSQSGLVVANEDGTGRIAFRHEAIRDYYGALYLQSLPTHAFHEDLTKYIEQFSWDIPLSMYCAMQRDPGHSAALVTRLDSYDKLLAVACAGYATAIPAEVALSLAGRIAVFQELQFISYKNTRIPIDSLSPEYHVLRHLPTGLLLDHLKRNAPSEHIMYAILLSIATSNDCLSVFEESFRRYTSMLGQSYVLEAARRVHSLAGLDFLLSKRGPGAAYGSLYMTGILLATPLSVREALALAKRHGHPRRYYNYTLSSLLSWVTEPSLEEIPLLHRIARDAHSPPGLQDDLIALKDRIAVLLMKLRDDYWQTRLVELSRARNRWAGFYYLSLLHNAILQNRPDVESYAITKIPHSWHVPSSKLLACFGGTAPLEWLAWSAYNEYDGIFEAIDLLSKSPDREASIAAVKALRKFPDTNRDRIHLILVHLGGAQLEDGIDTVKRICQRIAGVHPHNRPVVRGTTQYHNHTSSVKGNVGMQGMGQRSRLEDMRNLAIGLPIVGRHIASPILESVLAILRHDNSICGAVAVGAVVLARAQASQVDCVGLMREVLVLFEYYASFLDPLRFWACLLKAMESLTDRATAGEADLLFAGVYGTWRMWSESYWVDVEMSRILVRVSLRLTDGSRVQHLRRINSDLSRKDVPVGSKRRQLQCAYDICRAAGRRHLEVFKSWPPPAMCPKYK